MKVFTLRSTGADRLVHDRSGSIRVVDADEARARIAELEAEVERQNEMMTSHEACCHRSAALLTEVELMRAQVERLSRRPDLDAKQSRRVAEACEGYWPVLRDGRPLAGRYEDHETMLAALRAAAEQEGR